MIASIVVIGSVTSEQYQSVRIEELQKGNDPRIHRVNGGTKFLSEQYLPKIECPKNEYKQYAKFLEEIFKEIVYTPYPVAIIVDHETWTHWDQGAKNFFKELVNRNFEARIGYIDSEGTLATA